MHVFATATPEQILQSGKTGATEVTPPPVRRVEAEARPAGR
jgi:hypothetical protein